MEKKLIVFIVALSLFLFSIVSVFAIEGSLKESERNDELGKYSQKCEMKYNKISFRGCDKAFCYPNQLVRCDRFWFFDILTCSNSYNIECSEDPKCDSGYSIKEKKRCESDSASETAPSQRCLSKEDCSSNVDSDCDGLLPEKDSDCVKKVWTKPSTKSRWSWKCSWGKCSCNADAWYVPDEYYNPAEHSLYGLDPENWNCVVDKTYYDSSVSYFLGNGLSIKDIGGVWFAMNLYNKLPKILRDAINMFLPKDVDAEVRDYASKLPKPSSYTYTYACSYNGCCYDWDAVYALKRDWVCYHNDLETDKIFDWRSVDNKNWMTSVKQQSPCGSCWAFSALGAAEANYKIERNNAELRIDLSEQDIVSCSNAGSCDGGQNSLALSYAVTKGVSTEKCFPYTAKDSPCSPLCFEKFDIAESELIDYNRESIKNKLRTEGPVSVCMDWGDFMDWDANGIGRCRGKYDESGHCVTLVGYNDDGRYWIIKNSWGLGWFGNGYGKIGYGECRMETIRGTPAIPHEIRER